MDTTLNLSQTAATGDGYKETETNQSASLALSASIAMWIVLVIFPYITPIVATFIQHVVPYQDILSFHCKVTADTAVMIDIVVNNKTPVAAKLNKLKKIQPTNCKIISGYISTTHSFPIGLIDKRLDIDIFENSSKLDDNELLSIQNFKRERIREAENESSMQILSQILKNIAEVSSEPATIDQLAVTFSDKTDETSKELMASKTSGRIIEIDAVADFFGGLIDDVEKNDDNSKSVASVSGKIEGGANDCEDGWMDLADQ